MQFLSWWGKQNEERKGGFSDEEHSSREEYNSKGSHFSKKHDDFNKARRPEPVGWIMKLPNWKSSFTICFAVKCHNKITNTLSARGKKTIGEKNI